LSPSSTCGVNAGLCLPRSRKAISAASRPNDEPIGVDHHPFFFNIRRLSGISLAEHSIFHANKRKAPVGLRIDWRPFYAAFHMGSRLELRQHWQRIKGLPCNRSELPNWTLHSAPQLGQMGRSGMVKKNLAFSNEKVALTAGPPGARSMIIPIR